MRILRKIARRINYWRECANVSVKGAVIGIRRVGPSWNIGDCFVIFDQAGDQDRIEALGSDNAAQFGRYLLEVTTGIPVSLAAPSIFTLYKANINFDGVLVIAISQSGESTDTNLVLERAREDGLPVKTR